MRGLIVEKLSNYADIADQAQKKLSYVTSWENSKKAALEAKLRKIEATNPLSLRININDSPPVYYFYLCA